MSLPWDNEASDVAQCPGCERDADGENVYRDGAGYYCRVCDLECNKRDAFNRYGFIRISRSHNANRWRVEETRSLVNGRIAIDKTAALLNANRRHNTREQRVIERGELEQERLHRQEPKTLAQLWGISV